jgi:hypothetical protein
VSSSATRSAVSGVSSAGLCTTVLPAARAGASLLLDRISGKLNGVMAATTPIGSRRVYAKPGRRMLRVAPWMVSARPA